MDAQYYKKLCVHMYVCIFLCYMCAWICMKNTKYFETNIQFYPQIFILYIIVGNDELHRESFIQSIHTVSQICHKKYYFEYIQADMSKYLYIVIADC